MLSGTIAITILGTTCVAMASLSAVVFFINRRSGANQLFSVWMLSLAAWAVALMAFFAANSAGAALLWMRASYATAIIAVMVFFYFSTQFPRPTRLNWPVHIANVLTLGVLVGTIMGTRFIVVDIFGPPYPINVDISSLGWFIYAGYLLLYFLAAQVILFLKYRKAEGIERVQLGYVVWSVFAGGEVFGVTFNLLLPSPIFKQWELIWLGPAATAAVIVPFVTYAVTKHNLFNVKGIVTEVLVLYTAVFVIIDVVLSDSVPQFIFKSVLAAGVILVGGFLVKRINDDERRKAELQKLAADLASANHDLKNLDQLKSDFISIASHQLRTPISVMKGYLSLMTEGAYGAVSAQLREKIEQLYRMNDRLAHLVTNMLNVSRIEKEHIEFVYSDFPIGEVIDEVVDEMAYKAEERGLRLKVDPQPGPERRGVTVHADREKVFESLTNLIDNAIKYTKRGGITVAFGPREDGKEAIVRVIDTGTGIPKGAMDKLFTKFYRAKHGTDLGTQGTGLGLYVCRVFIEGMGGTIRVEKSEVGKGTTFLFTLPAAGRDHDA